MRINRRWRSPIIYIETEKMLAESGIPHTLLRMARLVYGKLRGERPCRAETWRLYWCSGRGKSPLRNAR